MPQDIGSKRHLGSQLSQFFLIGRILPGLCFGPAVRDFHPLEQHFAHLFWRSDIEAYPRFGIDLLLNHLDVFVQFFGVLSEVLAVYADTFVFHICQHFDERRLQFLVKKVQAFFLQSRCQLVLELPGNIRIFRSIFFYIFQRDVAHGALPSSFFTNQCFNRDRCIFKVGFCQVIHVMPQFGLYQIVRYHCIEVGSLERHTIPLEHDGIVFDILPDFQNAWM